MKIATEKLFYFILFFFIPEVRAKQKRFSLLLRLLKSHSEYGVKAIIKT